MAFRSARGWCDICRDEKPDVVCSEKRCRKGFHIDCLRNTGQLHEDDDFSNYLCSRCKDDEENDAFCYKCKCEGPPDSTLLLCDGCPRSAHLECLGLSDVPNTDTWMCPCCAPAAATQTAVSVKSTLVNVCGTRAKLGNVDICYVCQKGEQQFADAVAARHPPCWIASGGKLLCCDSCDQSFHPKCIDPESLDPTLFDETGKWACPICYGKDPLKNMSHKRMTKQERSRQSEQWQRCITRESRRCRANRDQFLYSCRAALKPFVSPEALAKLRKNALQSSRLLNHISGATGKPTARGGRNRGRREIPVVFDDDDDHDNKSESDTAEHVNTQSVAGRISQKVTSTASVEGKCSPAEVSTTAECEGPRSPAASDAVGVGPRSDSKENMELTVLYKEEKFIQKAEQAARQKSYDILREGVKLKPYQRWGINWLLDAFFHKAGAILADEMGLGKTIQTLVFLSSLKAMEISGPHLVVVPLSTVGNWIREVRKFTPSLAVTKICGSRQEREHSMADGVATAGIYDIFVTTYETVVTEEWFFTDQFRWQCVILDEAHRIKNESARIRHSLDRVECNMRVLLTGTPLQNNIKELFTLLNFLFPEVIKNSNAIDAVFHYPVGKRKPPAMASGTSSGAGFSSTVDDSRDQTLMLGTQTLDQEKVDAITALLSKLMLRRTKDLVVQLPEKKEYDIWLPLSPVAGRWYQRLLEITAAESDDSASSIRKLLGAVIKIRICCCHPRGLVSREPQLQSLIQSVRDAGCPNVSPETVEQEASLLKQMVFGWEHVRYSSKLFFLDKLLQQLHAENMRYCPEYREEYLATRANQLRMALNERTVRLNGLLAVKGGSERQPNIAEAIVRVEKELEVLKRPADRGGGLEGLDRLLYESMSRSPSCENPDFMTRYLFPSGTQTIPTPEQCAASQKESKSDVSDKKRIPTVAVATSASRETQSLSSATSGNSATLSDEQSSLPPVPRPRPHKILVFTQFQLVLDELAAYCTWRGWRFMRLDGSTNKMIRELDTREFNNPDSTHFVYLISTRAGGLGINLVTANHVVMYDEDWNPFVDLQAVDRAHRIGQTREVHVWRLMTEWTVEERMALRRQQKLELDKILIQANVESLDVSETDDAGGSQDKLSSDEVRRLIQYGRTALMETTFTDELESLSLEAVLARKRRDLRVVEDAKLKEAEDHLDASECRSWSREREESSLIGNTNDLSVEEFLLEESDDRAGTTTADTRNGRPDAVTDDTDETRSHNTGATTPVMEEEEKDPVDDEELAAALASVSDRPKRVRKQPKIMYNPTLRVDKVRLERKLLRERRCFRCGGAAILAPAQNLPVDNKGGSSAPNESTTSNNNTVCKEKDALPNASGKVVVDPLIGCMRCPKVYHMESCLGLDVAPPRSWMCPWHECCLCFRRAGSCGGLLIHCAECPTAFCFDCFPPEYRRYEPPAQFFEQLQRRGWHVTPKKLVTFLCSKCKALKEQERRRHLSKQQLEAEMRTRKSKDDLAREETRKQQLRNERNLAREQRQKEVDERKQFLEQKRKIDDYEKHLQDRLRKAVENLYPPGYLEILRQRRQRLIDLHQQSTSVLSTRSSQEAQTVPPKVFDDLQQRGSGEASESEYQVEILLAEPTEMKEEKNKLDVKDNTAGESKEDNVVNGRVKETGEEEVSLDVLQNVDKMVTTEKSADDKSATQMRALEEHTVFKPDPSATVVMQTPEMNANASRKASVIGSTHRTTLKSGSYSTAIQQQSHSGKKRLVIPDRLKSPADSLRLCENCHLPSHDALQCPFPAELTRIKVETTPITDSAPSGTINSTAESEPQPKSLSVETSTTVVLASTEPKGTTDTCLKEGEVDALETATVVIIADQQSVPTNENDTEITPALEKRRDGELSPSHTIAAVSSPDALNTSKPLTDASTAPKNDLRSVTALPDCAPPASPNIGGPKAKLKTVCSLCKNQGRIHSRKHCELLQDADREEYAARRRKYETLIKMLEKESISASDKMSGNEDENNVTQRQNTGCSARLIEVWNNSNIDALILTDKFLDLSRRQLNYCADVILQRVLRATDLGECIPKEALKPIDETNGAGVVGAENLSLKRETHEGSGKHSLTRYFPTAQGGKDRNRAGSASSQKMSLIMLDKELSASTADSVKQEDGGEDSDTSRSLGSTHRRERKIASSDAQAAGTGSISGRSLPLLVGLCKDSKKGGGSLKHASGGEGNKRLKSEKESSHTTAGTNKRKRRTPGPQIDPSAKDIEGNTSLQGLKKAASGEAKRVTKKGKFHNVNSSEEASSPSRTLDMAVSRKKQLPLQFNNIVNVPHDQPFLLGESATNPTAASALTGHNADPESFATKGGKDSDISLEDRDRPPSGVTAPPVALGTLSASRAVTRPKPPTVTTSSDLQERSKTDMIQKTNHKHHLQNDDSSQDNEKSHDSTSNVLSSSPSSKFETAASSGAPTVCSIPLSSKCLGSNEVVQAPPNEKKEGHSSKKTSSNSSSKSNSRSKKSSGTGENQTHRPFASQTSVSKDDEETTKRHHRRRRRPPVSSEQATTLSSLAPLIPAVSATDSGRCPTSASQRPTPCPSAPLLVSPLFQNPQGQHQDLKTSVMDQKGRTILAPTTTTKLSQLGPSSLPESSLSSHVTGGRFQNTFSFTDPSDCSSSSSHFLGHPSAYHFRGRGFTETAGDGLPPGANPGAIPAYSVGCIGPQSGFLASDPLGSTAAAQLQLQQHLAASNRNARQYVGALGGGAGSAEDGYRRMMAAAAAAAASTPAHPHSTHIGDGGTVATSVHAPPPSLQGRNVTNLVIPSISGGTNEGGLGLNTVNPFSPEAYAAAAAAAAAAASPWATVSGTHHHLRRATNSSNTHHHTHPHQSPSSSMPNLAHAPGQPTAHLPHPPQHPMTLPFLAAAAAAYPSQLFAAAAAAATATAPGTTATRLLPSAVSQHLPQTRLPPTPSPLTHNKGTAVPPPASSSSSSSSSSENDLGNYLPPQQSISVPRAGGAFSAPSSRFGPLYTSSPPSSSQHHPLLSSALSTSPPSSEPYNTLGATSSSPPHCGHQQYLRQQQQQAMSSPAVGHSTSGSSNCTTPAAAATSGHLSTAKPSLPMPANTLTLCIDPSGNEVSSPALLEIELDSFSPPPSPTPQR